MDARAGLVEGDLGLARPQLYCADEVAADGCAAEILSPMDGPLEKALLAARVWPPALVCLARRVLVVQLLPPQKHT